MRNFQAKHDIAPECVASKQVGFREVENSENLGRTSDEVNQPVNEFKIGLAIAFRVLTTESSPYELRIRSRPLDLTGPNLEVLTSLDL